MDPRSLDNGLINPYRSDAPPDAFRRVRERLRRGSVAALVVLLVAALALGAFGGSCSVLTDR